MHGSLGSRCEERRSAIGDGLLGLAPAPTVAVDATGRITAASPAFLHAFGYAEGDILGRRFASLVSRESRDVARAARAELARAGRCDRVRLRVARKDGGAVDVLASAVAAPDGAGFAVALTDIAPLADSERRLRESEGRYRDLVEGQTDLVALISVEGVLRYVNRAYADFCGVTPEAMVGRSLFDFVPEAEHAALAAHFRRVASTRESVETENQNITPDGATRWLAWSNHALFDASGAVTGIHSVGRDIQARVDAERRVLESEARYRFLAENSSDLILLVGDGLKRIYASPASRRMFGYEPEEMIALSLAETIHPDDAPRVLPVLGATPGDTTLAYRMRRKDGGYLWVETTGRSVETSDHKVQRLVIVRDIESRVAAERQLKASEARYRLLADNSTDMVFQLDENYVRRYASPSYREVLGFAPEEMVGERPADITHPEDVARLRLTFDTLMSGAAETLSIIYRIRHRDGRWLWVEVRVRALKDPLTGKPAGIIGAARDISARKAIEDELADANRRLEALAGQDALTRLANRRRFDEALDKEFHVARQEGRSLSLVMIDVDRFKAFNDRYGHPAGDACLQSIAGAITLSARRPGDVCARYGGEEFAIVLPGADEAGALTVARRIQQAVAKLGIEHGGSDHGFVTVSAGVAVAPAANPEALLQEADRALYLAKQGGRNAIVVAQTGAAASAA